MIEKELILKSINEAIQKCGAPKYFSRNTLKVFDKFAKDTLDLDHERGLYVDNDGNIIVEREGTTNSVHFKSHDAWSYVVGSGGFETDRYNEINIEHNHPTIDGFEAMPPLLSRGDTNKLSEVVNAGFVFRSITAESNGKRMSLIRQDKEEYRNSTSIDYDMIKKVSTACDNLDSALTDYIKEYGSRLEHYTNIPKSELSSFFRNPPSDLQSKEDRRRLSQKCLDDIGSLYEFLDKKGVVKELSDCDIELLLSE